MKKIFKEKRFYIFASIIILLFITSIIINLNIDKIQYNFKIKNENSISLEIKNKSLNQDNKTTYDLVFSSQIGISKIEYDNVVLNSFNKKLVAIDLEVNKDTNKIVKVYSSEGFSKEFEIKYMENYIENIKIKTGYQKLTNTEKIETGEEITVEVENSGNEIVDDYKIVYSINNGEWEEYTNIIGNLNQQDEIRVKCTGKNIYGESDIKKIRMPTSEKFSEDVFDGDSATSQNVTATSFFILDEDTKGQNFKVDAVSLHGSGSSIQIYSYDYNMNEKLVLNSQTYRGDVVIPEDAEYLKIVANGMQLRIISNSSIKKPASKGTLLFDVCDVGDTIYYFEKADWKVWKKNEDGTIQIIVNECVTGFNPRSNFENAREYLGNNENWKQYENEFAIIGSALGATTKEDYESRYNINPNVCKCVQYPNSGGVILLSERAPTLPWAALCVTGEIYYGGDDGNNNYSVRPVVTLKNTVKVKGDYYSTTGWELEN